jgi:hypothetical protein
VTHPRYRVLAAVLALGLAACGAERPTAPEAAEASFATLAVEGEALTAIRGAVTDANERLLSGLDAGAKGRLGAALDAVQGALAANDADALATTLEAAHAALAAERTALGADSPVAADLDALALTLGGLQDALPASMRGAVEIQ